MHDTGPAAATGFVGMECGRPASRLTDGHFSLVFLAGLEHIGRRPPPSLGNLGKTPGMAFPAGEIAARLINGKVIFRTGEMNSRDTPQRPLVGSLEGCFAGKGFPLVHLDVTATLRVSHLNQMAFHHFNLITAVLSLARHDPAVI
jgi:hypothetical protein